MTAAWEQPLVDINRPAEVPLSAARADQPPGLRPGAPRAAGGGVHADFQPWVERLRPRLARLAYRYLWNTHDAEEIVQDAIALAWREVGRQDLLRNRDAWLYRVTINLCLNRLRRVQAGPLPAGEVAIAARAEAIPAEADEITQRVRAVIAELPERQQTALVLRDIEGLAYEEIAAVLEIRAGAARLCVYRARESVREILLKRWPDSFGPE